jgi:hypothetical protein
VKNYTSQVPAERTIGEIEDLLIRAGARSISKEYHEGQITALNFVLLVPETNSPIGVRLPADPEAVYNVLMRGRKNRDAATQRRVREQAARTAWRLMFDWCAVQLSLHEMKQAELMQIFLPYLWVGKGTFYAAIKETKFAALGHSPPAESE